MIRILRCLTSYFPAFPMDRPILRWASIVFLPEVIVEKGSQAVDAQRSHRWKVLGVGFAANASFAAAFSGIPTTAVFLRSGYHIGNSGLGLVLGMLGLGIAVSELPWGLLTDRWGDRRVLLLGLGATAAALAAMALFVVPRGAQVPG